MASPTFRAFIAIELPEAIRAVLAGLLEGLRRHDHARAVRWVRPEGVHLTLQFLGETPESRVEALQAAMAAVAARHRPFGLRLGPLGFFPQGSRGGARVLWVGLTGEVNAAGALQRDLATALTALGHQPERRDFSPHLTLGRVPGSRFDAATLFQGVAWPPAEEPSFRAEGISLMQSTLLPQGARYALRLFLPLGEA